MKRFAKSVFLVAIGATGASLVILTAMNKDEAEKKKLFAEIDSWRARN